MRMGRGSNENVSGKSQASSKRKRHESCAEHGVSVVANVPVDADDAFLGLGLRWDGMG